MMNFAYFDSREGLGPSSLETKGLYPLQLDTIFSLKKDLQTDYGYSYLVHGSHFIKNELSVPVTSKNIPIVKNDKVRGFK